MKCRKRSFAVVSALLQCFCREGGYLRSRALWLHSCHAGGASHAGKTAGQLADSDPRRSAMTSLSASDAVDGFSTGMRVHARRCC